MKVTLVGNTITSDIICGQAAAICTKSSKPLKALESALESGHYGVLEHAVFTFRIEGLSRAALAQLTRHRLASFDVQSQRYVRISSDNLVLPQTLEEHEDLAARVNNLMEEVMDLYQDLVDAGVPKEDARYITPQAVPTILIMTMNARELLHFFSLRCCNRAQWEIRELADQMLVLCKETAPTIFRKAGPDCVTGTCHEKHPCGNPRSKEW